MITAWIGVLTKKLTYLNKTVKLNKLIRPIFKCKPTTKLEILNPWKLTNKRHLNKWFKNATVWIKLVAIVNNILQMVVLDNSNMCKVSYKICKTKLLLSRNHLLLTFKSILEVLISYTKIITLQVPGVLRLRLNTTMLIMLPNTYLWKSICN